MSHETLREQVVDLALGLLDPAEAREVEAHAASCPACAAELASLRATRSALTALPPLPAPERGEAVLLAAARQAAEGAAERRRWRLPRWVLGASLGAATAAAALLLTFRLSGVAPASRFDEGREALDGRGPAPAEASKGGAPAAPEVSAKAAPPEVARAAAERSAGVAAAPPPPAPASPARLAEAAPAAQAAEAKKVERLADAAPAGVAAQAPSLAPPPAPAMAVRADAAGDAAGATEGLGVLGGSSGPAQARPAAAKIAPAPRPAALAAPSAAPAAESSAGLAAPRGALRKAEAEAAAPAPAEARRRAAAAACPGERVRTLSRDAAGRVTGRTRMGLLGGVEYQAEERFGPDGRLASATVRLGGRVVDLDDAALRAGGLTPWPGLRLAATAAEAEAAPPACGP